MENEIAFLKTDDGLDFKLTTDKLYITSATGTETFALRSINGIGVIDLVERYNSALSALKGLNTSNQLNGTLCAAGGLLIAWFSFSKEITVGGLFGLGFIGLGVYFFSRKRIKPELMSSVRIMLNGMNRDFEFNKRKVNSTDVANFVARVEDTLTAFHKNQ